MNRHQGSNPTEQEELEYRAATPEDASDLFPVWSDLDVTQYTLIRDIGSVADCAARIERQRQRIAIEGGLGPLCARCRGRAIGYFGATVIEGKSDEYEIFYNLSKTHWGKGWGTAMARIPKDPENSGRRCDLYLYETDGPGRPDDNS